MNTKILMTTSSVVLYLLGMFALFVPHELLRVLNLQVTNPLPVVIQILGSLYLSLALTNWIAKDSAIGGIYARPISMGNMAHFTIGAIIITKSLFANGFHLPLLIVQIVYTVFAGVFAWLVFAYSGIASKKKVQE